MSDKEENLTGYGVFYEKDKILNMGMDPFVYEGTVKPEWIDINGHMNVAYYVKAFDLAIDTHWAELGITADYIENEQCSTFSVECHITYQNEMRVDDEYRIISNILAYDEKRIHLFQTMYKIGAEETIATAEWMNLHVNLRTRKVCEWPKTVLDNLRKVSHTQKDRKWPSEAGKRMSIKNPIFSVD